MEIFDLKQNQLSMNQLEFKKLIKGVYLKYMKIYHPDISKNIEIHDAQGTLLNDEQKRTRFDQIQNAYDILKDPRRRIAYGRYTSSSWDKDDGRGGVYSSFNYNKATPFEAFRNTSAHSGRYDFSRNEAFWKAGTWDDYYRMTHQRAPPTMKEINKNKIKILIGVVAVAVLVFALQLMLAIEKTNEYIRQTKLKNLKAMRDLNQSYGPPESTQLQRLNRFLVDRRATLVNHGANEQEIRDQDNQLLSEFAKRQVRKFDQEGKD
jgi:curved DNA-binding protein CbpA